MKKINIIVFVEGQTELIFLCHLLQLIFGYEKVGFKCVKYRNSQNEVISFPKQEGNNPKFNFQIIDVGNDEKVLKVIRKRERDLVEKGFIIWGLRDMYSNKYKKVKKGICKKTIVQFIRGTDEEIKTMSNANKIKIYFAVMETEAWFLAFYKVFERVNKKLTVDFIKQKLKINLEKIDPEKKFFHPASDLEKIFSLVEESYKKDKNDCHKVINRITNWDIEKARSKGKIASFFLLYDELNNLKNN